MSEKVIITCAVTGAETTRAQNPALPITPEEIADEAMAAREAGAAIVHLHVRDDSGAPTQDIGVFRDTISRIRQKCDIVVEVTTGGAVGMSLEERMQPLLLDPEMASLDCGTSNFGDDYIVNTLPMIREVAEEMRTRGIRPTLECFDLSHVDAAEMLVRSRLVPRPCHFGLVLGVPAGLRYDLETLMLMVNRLPPGCHWTLVGIGGKVGFKKIENALSLKGHVRVGMEDNVYFEKGRLAKSNAELVARAAHTAKSHGRQVATPEDVRRLLELRTR